VLAASVRELHHYLRSEFTFAFQITIADNASTDATLEIAEALARDLTEVAALHLKEKGRGRALRAAWSRSDADVIAYMDVDLSTDLSALPALLLPLLQVRGDITIGSRLAPGARVRRGLRRELISRAYMGSDPSPTLSQLKRMVSRGELHYVLLNSAAGAGMGRPGFSTSATKARDGWIESHGKVVTISGKSNAGMTLYYLSSTA
jgi:glycosyltransferase involved in cell wall biosynthesis